jgi:hypothetical protein
LRGGNEYEQDYAHLAEIKALADRTGIAIVVVHHTRKSESLDPHEDISGTHGISGAVDSTIVLRRERGQHDACLHVTGRDVEEQELALTWDPEYCLWQLAGNAEEFRMSKERADVVALLRAEGQPMTPTMVATAMNKGNNAVKLLLSRMAKEGQIEALGGGRYTSSKRERHSGYSDTVDTRDTRDTGRVSEPRRRDTIGDTSSDWDNCPFR